MKLSQLTLRTIKRKLSEYKITQEQSVDTQHSNKTIPNNGFFRTKILSTLKPFQCKTKIHLKTEMLTQIQEHWYKKKRIRCLNSNIFRICEL